MAVCVILGMTGLGRVSVWQGENDRECLQSIHSDQSRVIRGSDWTCLYGEQLGEEGSASKSGSTYHLTLDLEHNIGHITEYWKHRTKHNGLNIRIGTEYSA